MQHSTSTFAAPLVLAAALAFGPLDAQEPVADRTASFRVTAAEAWGSVGTVPSAFDTDAAVAPGAARRLEARICSSRGACTSIAAVVHIVPSGPAAPDSTSSVAAAPSGTRPRLLRALVEAVRRLLVLPR